MHGNYDLVLYYVLIIRGCMGHYINSVHRKEHAWIRCISSRLFHLKVVLHST